MVNVTGFAHAPVTKGILITTTIASLVVGIFHLAPYANLHVSPHLTLHHQLWRLAAHHLAFTSSADLFLSLLLLYGAGRQVERTFGTPKYAAFLLSVTALYTLLLVITLLALHRSAPGGPIGPLFSILYQHMRIIPDRWIVSLPPFAIGERTIRLYALGLVLFLSHPIPAVLAIAASFMYSSDFILFAHIKQWRIPPPIYTFLVRIITPFIGSTRTPTRSWRPEPPSSQSNRDQDQDQDQDQDRDRDGLRRRTESQRTVALDTAILGGIWRRASARAAAPRTGIRDFFTQIGPAAQIAETDIAALQAMFPNVQRSDLVAALQQSDGSQTSAIERLLIQHLQGTR